MFTLPIINNKEFTNNENSKQCVPCGGSCCKSFPGAYHEEQLSELTSLLPGMSVDEFNEYLHKHNLLCEDRWFTVKDESGNIENVYFYNIRPKSENGLWGGRCINLSMDGCKLSFDKRPFVCKAVVPDRTVTTKGVMLECSAKFSDEPIELSNRVMLFSLWRKSQKELFRLNNNYNYDEQKLISAAKEEQTEHIKYVMEHKNM